MKRRHFITTAVGAATWTLAARAQTPPMPVVSFLRSTSLADAERLIAAFRKGLNQAGFSEDRNVRIEFRSAEGKNDRLPTIIKDLIASGVKIIVANLPAARAAKAITSTVPIVFGTGGDPVKDGLVSSLNRPGGNLTGVVYISAFVGSKRLEQLRQIVPKAGVMGVIVHLDTDSQRNELHEIELAAPSMGQKLVIYEAKNVPDIDTGFSKLVQDRADAVFVGSGAFLNSYRDRVVALAARYRLPASYNDRAFTEKGGLISYGASITDGYRQMGIYAGRILKGERPSDLPVIEATKIELVINLKTAKELGLTVPDRLVVSADDLIE